MNRDNESERDSQRTVADLLAQYGDGPGGGSAPRRRRRRAEDANETAPQQIIDRVLSDSGQMRALRDEEPPPAEPPPPAPPRAAGVDAPSRRDLPGYEAQPSFDTPSGRFARPATPTRPVPPPVPPPVSAPDAAELTTEVPAITDSYPAIPEAPGTSTSGRLPRPEAPPVPPKPAPRAKPRVQPDPVTEVLPAVVDAPAADPDAPAREGEDWFTDTGYQEPYTDEGEHTAQYQAVRVPEEEAEPEPEEEARPARGPAGLDEDAEVPDNYDEDEDDEERSPAKEWLMMIVQLGGGVLGGAGLWLGFQFLWRAMPAITLVLALAVIGGLVWLVRKIRKADDLQTILLAVLVGLVVTVSPAALLLVGK